MFLDTTTIFFSSLIQLQTSLHFVSVSAFPLQRASDYSASFLPFNPSFNTEDERTQTDSVRPQGEHLHLFQLFLPVTGEQLAHEL